MYYETVVLFLDKPQGCFTDAMGNQSAIGAARLGFKPPTSMLTGDTANKHIEKAKLFADRILFPNRNFDTWDS